MTRNPFLHRASIIGLVVLPLVGTIAAVVLLWNTYVFASDLILLFVFYAISCLGITIGYHRMLTHQGFETPAVIRFFFTAAGAMAFEGAPDVWVATHIKHHAHSDDEDDPHSPLEGFWHAHLGWLFQLKNFPLVEEYAPHLLKDPIVSFVSRTYGFWLGLSLFLPFLLGGWTGFLWGGLVRIFLTTHVTWSVNSVCHTFGNRAFQTTDESRNEWIVGLLAFGEGWHNNHHAFPRSAFHGLHWWQIDMSGWIIAALEKLGLAWKVQRVSPETIASQKQRAASAFDVLHQMKSDLLASIAALQSDLSAAMLERSPQAHASMVAAYEQAAERLAAIQRRVSTATNVKRHRLQAYIAEVQKLAQETQRMMRGATTA